MAEGLSAQPKPRDFAYEIVRGVGRTGRGFRVEMPGGRNRQGRSLAAREALRAVRRRVQGVGRPQPFDLRFERGER